MLHTHQLVNYNSLSLSGFFYFVVAVYLLMIIQFMPMLMESLGRYNKKLPINYVLFSLINITLHM